MKKVLILGATSNISCYLIPMLLKQKNVYLTLLTRNGIKRLSPQYSKNSRVKIIDGNWNNIDDIKGAVKDQDIVFLATGHFIQANKNVVKVMEEEHVNRLIVAGCLGIYEKIPGKFGKWNKKMMGDIYTLKKAADVIINSDLDYTYMRMAWLYDQDGNERYQLIHQGESYRATQLTRQAAARFIADVVANPNLASHENIGVAEPRTEWDKPSFY